MICCARKANLFITTHGFVLSTTNDMFWATQFYISFDNFFSDKTPSFKMADEISRDLSVLELYRHQPFAVYCFMVPEDLAVTKAAFGLHDEMNITDTTRLTHCGRVMHICVSKFTIIGSDNGLSPWRRQAIIWTNAGILLIWSLGTHFSEI